MISKLKLEKNRVIIRLPDILADSDSDDDDDDDDSSDDDDDKHQAKAKAKKAFVDVDLDLSMSAYANASKLYSQRKVARSKEQKTAVAAERAIKAVSHSHAILLSLYPIFFIILGYSSLFSSVSSSSSSSSSSFITQPGGVKQLEATGEATSQAQPPGAAQSALVREV